MMPMIPPNTTAPMVLQIVAKLSLVVTVSFMLATETEVAGRESRQVLACAFTFAYTGICIHPTTTRTHRMSMFYKEFSGCEHRSHDEIERFHGSPSMAA